MKSNWITGTVFGVFAASMLLPNISHAQRQVSRLDPNGNSSYGGGALESGFTPDPKTFRLTAGYGGRRTDWAEVSALNLRDAVSGETCSRAYVAAKKDFAFIFGAGHFSMVRFYVVTDDPNVDATLLINQPDGKWRCNDDHGKDNWGHATAPVVDFNSPQSGRYDIWVGTFEASSNNPATLSITELDSNHP